MNPEELRKLESRLREYKPAAVDPQLETSIRKRLRKTASSQRLTALRSGLAWAGLAAAACLLVAFGFLLFDGRLVSDDRSPVPPVAVDTPPDGEPTLDTFKPVLAENNLESRIDEGIVFLQNGMTARRYRYQFIDRVVWKNPSDGAVVEMEIPRDEVVLVPVMTF